MNGLSLKTVIPGRNKIPGIYSSNFDPTAHSTMPMLTRLAIGALVIQTATLDPQCVESCTLALWIKTCPADCDDSTWQSINLGPVVLPPDVHCVSGQLIGNILHLVLTDGSTIDVDLSPLAVDNNTFLTNLNLAGNTLTGTLNSGATVSVDLSPLAVDTFLTNLNLTGTVLTATLNSGATVPVDLSPLVYSKPSPVTIPLADTVGWTDPNWPTDAEIAAWLTANPQAPDTLIILQGIGPVGSPDHVWEVGPGAALTHVEKPVDDLCTQLTDLDDALDGTIPLTATIPYVRNDGQCGRAQIYIPQRVTGISPFVINATTIAANWANGQTQSTPIATLSVTNPSTDRPLQGTIWLFHGLYVRMANAVGNNLKNSALSALSVVDLDDGGGTLQNPVSFYPLFNGNPQIIAQAVVHDSGAAAASAGNQTQHMGQLPVTIPPGATVTFRSQSTLTIHDGDGLATVWTYNRISFDGMVY